MLKNLVLGGLLFTTPALALDYKPTLKASEGDVEHELQTRLRHHMYGYVMDEDQRRSIYNDLILLQDDWDNYLRYRSEYTKDSPKPSVGYSRNLQYPNYMWAYVCFQLLHCYYISITTDRIAYHRHENTQLGSPIRKWVVRIDVDEKVDPPGNRTALKDE